MDSMEESMEDSKNVTQRDVQHHDDDIRITIRTPKKIGSRSADQQMINAYLANQLAIVQQKLAECQCHSSPTTIVRPFPRIRVRV